MSEFMLVDLGYATAKIKHSKDPKDHISLQLTAPSGIHEGVFVPAESFEINGKFVIALRDALNRAFPAEVMG